jgi:hypothetical protein
MVPWYGLGMGIRTYSLITSVHPDKTQWLIDCARSVLTQQLPHGWELQWLLMVDGGGPQSGKEVLDQLRGLPNLHTAYVGSLTRQRGIACARNLALSQACGELVRALDADDELPENAIAHDIEAMEQHQEALWCASSCYNLDDEGNLDGWLDPPGGWVARGQLGVWWEGRGLRGEHEEPEVLPIHPISFCVRAQWLRALGGWMGVAPGGEETGLVLALSETGPGWFIDQPGLHYRVWSGSSTKHPEFGTAEARGAAWAATHRLRAIRELQALGAWPQLEAPSGSLSVASPLPPEGTPPEERGYGA